MNTGIHKALAAVLAILLFAGLPGAASAGDRRGANLIITRKDGLRVEGELIAVKPEALLLLSPAGKDESVALADILSIKIPRKSRAWERSRWGLLAGAAAGALYGAGVGEADVPIPPFAFGAIYFGAIGGVAGLIAGMAYDVGGEIILPGQPESLVHKALARLDRRAREPGAFMTPKTGGIDLPRAEFPRPKTPRFKLTGSAGISLGEKYPSSQEMGFSARFVDGLPSWGPGSFGTFLQTFDTRPSLSVGRLNFGCELSRNWGAEAELFFPRKFRSDRFSSIMFTSSVDGRNYQATVHFDENVNAVSPLLGLTFRPFPTEFLQPHVLEAGVAAGPAWITVKASPDETRTDPKRILRELTWTARVRAAYDFYFSPAFSLGTFAEYRRFKADIPGYAYTADLDFNAPESGYSTEVISRKTELAIPGRTIDLGGFALGLRVGLKL